MEEIEDHAIEFESFGMCDDYVSVGWAKEIIRSHMDEVPDNNAGWIPVSERLPEDERMVLVTCQTKKGLGVQTGHIMTESFGMEAVRCQA